jgi:hypothetical protein
MFDQIFNCFRHETSQNHFSLAFLDDASNKKSRLETGKNVIKKKTQKKKKAKYKKAKEWFNNYCGHQKMLKM